MAAVHCVQDAVFDARELLKDGELLEANAFLMRIHARAEQEQRAITIDVDAEREQRAQQRALAIDVDAAAGPSEAAIDRVLTPASLPDDDAGADDAEQILRADAAARTAWERIHLEPHADLHSLPWNCKGCTFQNNINRELCGMCEVERFEQVHKEYSSARASAEAKRLAADEAVAAAAAAAAHADTLRPAEALGSTPRAPLALASPATVPAAQRSSRAPPALASPRPAVVSAAQETMRRSLLQQMRGDAMALSPLEAETRAKLSQQRAAHSTSAAYQGRKRRSVVAASGNKRGKKKAKNGRRSRAIPESQVPFERMADEEEANSKKADVDLGGKLYQDEVNHDVYTCVELAGNTDGRRNWTVKKVDTGRDRQRPYDQGYLMWRISVYEQADDAAEASSDAVDADDDADESYEGEQ